MYKNKICFFIITLFLFSNIEAKKSLKKPQEASVRAESVFKRFIKNPLFFFSDNFHVVEKGVCYRSKQLQPRRLKKYVKKYGIKTIINLRGVNKNKMWWQKENEITKKSGIDLVNISLYSKAFPDKGNIINLLETFKNAKRPILIHCWSGADRTGLTSALWMLEQRQKSLKKSLRQLSFRYGHVKFFCPDMRRFVKIWGKSNI